MNLRGVLLAAGLILASGSPVLARAVCPVPTPDCALSGIQANGPEAEGVVGTAQQGEVPATAVGQR